MKITKKLYNKMVRCCKLQQKASLVEQEIEDELRDKGIDNDELRNNDGDLVQFINYGEMFSKEGIEQDLDKYIAEKKEMAK